MTRLASLVVLLVVLTGCTSYTVTQMPLRDATIYPVSETQSGVAVAVDSIARPERARKYFGLDLIQEGVLPVNITVSNHSERKVLLKPANLLVHRGREVIDSLPIERVTEQIKGAYWMEPATREEVDKYLAELALQEAFIGRQQDYQGVLFLELGRPARQNPFSFQVLQLFRQTQLQLHITLTDQQTNERLSFGPFPIATP